MMRQLRTKLLLTLACLAQILVACGGGGDSEVAADDASITTSGSITVNGSRFHTEGVDTSIDGNSDPEPDFAIGMVGRNASIRASRVVREDMLNGNTLNEYEGSINNLDTTGQTLSIDVPSVGYDAGTAF